MLAYLEKEYYHQDMETPNLQLEQFYIDLMIVDLFSKMWQSVRAIE